jgi:hypothetical protein
LRLAAFLAAKADGGTVGEAVDRQLRVLARTSLDNYSIGPIALQLCWCLFGDFLRASTGLDGVDDRTFAQSIGATVALILDADVPLVS